MKRAVRLAVALMSMTALLIIGSVSVHAADGDYAYDANKALSYAKKHYTDKKAYDGGKLDCVKFVKKSVEAGGIPAEADRSYGYTPEDYVKYIKDNGWADYYELQLTVHPWSITKGTPRYYVDLDLNVGKVSPGDILVYKCNHSKCSKTTFHLELVHDVEAGVTSYAHNTNKGPSIGNDNVITFPHPSCKSNGATDENTEIWVLHFKDDPYLLCQHESAKYTVIKKATFSVAGEKTAVCSTCGKTTTKVIPAVKKYYLSSTAYTYNGKSKRPTVVMWDTKGKNLYELTAKEVNANKKNGFTAVYQSGRKNVGQYTVDVTLEGPEYEGEKTFTFKINPKGTSVSKLTAAKKAFTVKWKKQSTKMAKSRITGYEIRYSTSKSKLSKAKPVTVKGYSKTSKKISKLTSKKYYYVQVRTYMTVDDVKYYSSWSSAKKVKTK